jgi:D-serine deaminase-like pyridoxal phosphate-dependent protein
MTDHQHNTWYRLQQAEQVDSPALLIYPQRVMQNIATLKNMIDDPLRLRPHVKTTKSKEAIQLLLAAGIQKFKCATIAEAELLGLCGAKDVVLAYQPVGPKLVRFMEVMRQYPATRFACLLDNQKTADELSATALGYQVVLPVYIDLNIGMNRTGIVPGEAAVALYEYGAQLAGITMTGLHAYDGHIRETDLQQRKEACALAMAPVEEMQSVLQRKGYSRPVIIAGGSPTFPVHAGKKEIECSPGTFMYWDKTYSDQYPDQSFLQAALVITRVVSLPAPHLVCVDLGSKSIASEMPLEQRVWFINAPGLKAVSQSEEHLVLEAGVGHHWKVGELLYGIPRHVCPTCALYEAATTVEGGKVTGSWKIAARDRKLKI